jgi:Flp pilus assembly protein TadG
MTDTGEREAGSIAAFMALLAVALLALVGLVVDGGRSVAARQEALDDAQQAARAGAGQLSIVALRAGQVLLDPGAAASAARKYLASAGVDGTVAVIGQEVTVQVDLQEPTTFLGLVGLRTINISADASATNVHGVTRED